MDWPRCKYCGELMCCDGKGNYECISDHAIKDKQYKCRECGQALLGELVVEAVTLGYTIVCWDEGRRHYCMMGF